MNKRQSAEQFSREVDRLLAGSSQWADGDKDQAGYDSDFDVARLMATSDYSSESRIREALRACLVRQMEDVRELSRLKKLERKETLMRVMRNYIWRPLPTATLVAIILATFVVPLVWPGKLSAAAQSVDEAVQKLIVGKNTTVEQISPEKDQAIKKRGSAELPEGMWFVSTPVGGFGGGTPEGKDSTVRYYHTFELAQKQVPNVKFLYPASIPDGYALREALVTPMDSIILTFSHVTGEKTDIILAEQPVQKIQYTSKGKSVTVGSGVAVMGNAPVESVTVSGNQAAWMSGGTPSRNSLVWEANGISFTVGGIGMPLDDAIRFAESLK